VTTSSTNRRILVGIDGSPQSRVALEWAAREAQRGGGEIDAVHVYGSGLAWIDVGSDAEPLILARSAENAKQTLHEIIAAAELPAETDVRIEPVVVLGEPSAVLCDRARSADLLVVGTRGHGGFAGLLLGSVSQRCAERSPCPVVVVPSEYTPTVEAPGARRIIVGIDGSAGSRHALEWALAESASDGDEIEAVLAFNQDLLWVPVEAEIQAKIDAAAEQRAMAIVRDAVTQARTPTDGATVIPTVALGEPWRVLLATAAGADLLVVGTRGRGGFAGLLLGSVSHRCVERSTCPVVVVPPSSVDTQEGDAS
jgi:nucleotide-binding universal stress UspA family protein